MNYFDDIPSSLNFMKELLPPGTSFDGTVSFSFGHSPAVHPRKERIHHPRCLSGQGCSSCTHTSILSRRTARRKEWITPVEIMDVCGMTSTSRSGLRAVKRRRAAIKKITCRKGKTKAEMSENDRTEADFFSFLNRLVSECQSHAPGSNVLMITNVCCDPFVTVVRAIYDEYKDMISKRGITDVFLHDLAKAICNDLSAGETTRRGEALKGHRSRKRKILQMNKIVRGAMGKYFLGIK